MHTHTHITSHMSRMPAHRCAYSESFQFSSTTLAVIVTHRRREAATARMDLHARGIINSAENVAIGLKQLRDTLPEYSAEITSVVADLYAISATLTSLDGLARQFPRNYGQIKPDLDPALASLRYTLNGIINSLGKLDRTSLADNYRRIWHDLDAYFHEEDGYSLARRLTKYKLFLQELQDVMQKYYFI